MKRLLVLVMMVAIAVCPLRDVSAQFTFPVGFMETTAAGGAPGTAATDYLSDRLDLTGGTTLTTTKMLMSFWAKFNGSGRRIFEIQSDTSSPRFTLNYDGNRRIHTFLYDSSGTLLGNNASTTAISLSAWHHVLIAVDTDPAADSWEVYVDDVSYSGTPSVSTGTMQFDGANYKHRFAMAHTGAFGLSACISELYFAPDQWLDITIESNRRKFIDASGAPVDLGNDGGTPTGTAPKLFAPDGNPETNAGSWDDFTLTGTLATCGSPPVP